MLDTRKCILRGRREEEEEEEEEVLECSRR